VYMKSFFGPMKSLNTSELKTSHIFIGLFIFVFCIQLFFIFDRGIPAPFINDEASHLVNADAFSHGRIAGPGHALPEFFEASFELLNPVHAAMYPPGQGFFLALGKIFLGHPFYGVVLGMALFSACFYWMMRSVTDNDSATIYALFITALFGAGNYWSRSYYGSCVFSAGICLTFGAYLYCLKQNRLVKQWQFSAGCMLMFFTRPYEGGVLFLAIISCYIFDIVKSHIHLTGSRRFFTVLLILATASVCFQGYYNYRVTGHPLKMPYSVYFKDYRKVPIFWFQDFKKPERKAVNPTFKNITLGEMYQYKPSRHHDNIEKLYYFGKKFWGILNEYSYWMIIIPIFFMAGTDRYVRRMLFIIAICVTGSAIVTWNLSHYIATSTLTILTLTFYMLFKLEEKLKDSLKGKAIYILKIIMITLVYYVFFSNVIQTGKAWLYQSGNFRINYYDVMGYFERAPGLQLVFSQYAPDTTVSESAFRNLSDIDAQKTVFANDLGYEKNKQLMGYYESIGQNRKPWVLCINNNNRAVIRDYISKKAENKTLCNFVSEGTGL
jgi:hypothetical protein